MTHEVHPKQDIILAMIEHRGLTFILNDRHKEAYKRFLKKNEQYKQTIREKAKHA